MILYRILSVFVNMFSALLLFSALFMLSLALANPGALLEFFMLVATVLYAWFANKFKHQVLIRKEAVGKRLKDWLQVNAIVAFIFLVISISGSVSLLLDKEAINEMLKAIPKEYAVSASLIQNTAIFFIFCTTTYIIHIIWTILLVRKHADYFVE